MRPPHAAIRLPWPDWVRPLAVFSLPIAESLPGHFQVTPGPRRGDRVYNRGRTGGQDGNFVLLLQRLFWSDAARTVVSKEGCAMAVEKLEKHVLFELLNPNEVERLSNASGVAKFKEGERAYSEGMPASHLFILLKGRVELRRPTKGGPSLLVDDVLEGSIFGVSSLMGTERYLVNAECVQDSEVLKVEDRALRRILDENPAVGYAIQRRISQIFFRRYVDAMERLETIVQAMSLRGA